MAEGGRNRAVAAQQAQREIERLRLEEQRLKLEQVGQGGATGLGIASKQQLQSWSDRKRNNWDSIMWAMGRCRSHVLWMVW